jgi:hypothetical protein
MMSVVLQADQKTAQNGLARLFNLAIDWFMSCKQVKAILLERTEHFRLGLLSQDSSCSPVMALSTENE